MSSWLDEDEQEQRTTNRPRTDDDIETFEPPAIRQETEDIAGLALVAREAGPRNRDDMLKEARETGARLGAILDKVGEGTAAYYRWTVKSKDGPSVIEGPTIDLMDALVGIWGRVIYSVRILSEKGPRVVLRCRVFDLTSIVAHERDTPVFLRPAPGKFAEKPDEAERWRVMQLASAESKMIRSVLNHVIPSWLTETALNAARDAAAKKRTGGKTLSEAVSKAVDGFRKLSSDLEQVIRWVGKPVAAWDSFTLQELRELYRRLDHGELTAERLRAEASARETARTLDTDTAPDDPPPDADRLAGLGLGKPTPTTTTPPLPSPEAGTQAPPASGGGPRVEVPPGQSAPTVDPDQEERSQLVGLLTQLSADLPEATRDSLRAQHELRRIDPKRVDLVKLRALVEAAKRAVADRVKRDDQVVVPDPWDGPTGEELRFAVREDLGQIGAEGTKQLLTRAGIPAVDGAPEEGLRRLLVLTTAELVSRQEIEDAERSGEEG